MLSTHRWLREMHFSRMIHVLAPRVNNNQPCDHSDPGGENKQHNQVLIPCSDGLAMMFGAQWIFCSREVWQLTHSVLPCPWCMRPPHRGGQNPGTRDSWQQVGLADHVCWLRLLFIKNWQTDNKHEWPACWPLNPLTSWRDPSSHTGQRLNHLTKCQANKPADMHQF